MPTLRVAPVHPLMRPRRHSRTILRALSLAVAGVPLLACASDPDTAIQVRANAKGKGFDK